MSRMVFQYPKYVRIWEYIQINIMNGRNWPFPVYLMYFPETLFGRQERSHQREVDNLKAKLSQKDEVIAELLTEHIGLKKKTGVKN